MHTFFVATESTLMKFRVAVASNKVATNFWGEQNMRKVPTNLEACSPYRTKQEEIVQQKEFTSVRKGWQLKFN